MLVFLPSQRLRRKPKANVKWYRPFAGLVNDRLAIGATLSLPNVYARIPLTDRSIPHHCVHICTNTEFRQSRTFRSSFVTCAANPNRAYAPHVPGQLPADLAERVLSSHPLPIADATSALVSADSAFEQRDRVVEVFRAALRTVSALVLAARIQFGKGPGTESAQIPELIRSLRSRGLTDGQWFAIIREMLRPWAQAPGSYPLADLVTLIHAKKSEFPKLIDELLAMRKSETVAHGASGTKAAIVEILDRRVPQLAKVLALLEPIWAKARLVVPLAKPPSDDELQGAWLLMGDTPARGKWRRIELPAGVHVAPGEALIVDAEDKPLLALHPLVLVRRPSPEAVEEVFVLDGGSKKGAVFVALPSMAEHRETEAWSALSKALDDQEAPPENPEIGGVERPFRGLSSFGPEHAALFFGREELTEALANRIRRHPFVTVTGPSGSGKTSLLRAGALPTLADYAVALIRPGTKPLEALATKLAESMSHYHSSNDLLAKLNENPASLGALIADWSQNAAPASSQSPSIGKVFRIAGELTTPKMAIIIDQAEEMLTLCHDDKERLAFAKALASAAASPDAPSRVVLSVREDFFGRIATVPPLRGLYSQVVEVVTTPDRDALARTLYLPAKQFGYSFEDEQLITTMVDTVATEPAALALLQFCADRLWEVRDRTWKRLTWDAYRALGGVEGALAAHADNVYTGLSPAQQKACRGLLLRLVTAERTRAVLGKRELLETSAQPEDATFVVDRLTEARLLTVGEADSGGETRVEIVHEALIRHWSTLSGWLDEDVEGQRLTHALRQAAKEWETRKRPRGLLWRGDALDDLRRFRKRATDRLTAEESAFVEASEADERKGTRLRRGLTAGAFVATGAFATFMFFQWRAAEDARVETEHQKARAEVRGLVSEARNQEPAGKVGEALALLRAASALETAEKETGNTLVSLDMERLARAGAAARVLSGHAWGLMRVVVSPDKQNVATASRDGTVKIWNIATGALLKTLEGTEPILSVAYSPDGKMLSTTNGTIKADAGFARIWNVEGGKEVHALKFDSTVNSATFSPDGQLLLTCADKTGATLWNVQTGAKIAGLGDPSDVQEGSFSTNGKLVLVRSGKTVRVFDTTKAALVATLEGHERNVLEAVFSKSGDHIATASTDGTARIWEAQSGKELAKLAPESLGYGKVTSFHAIAFSPDGSTFAVGSKDGVVRIVNSQTAAVLHSCSAHSSQIETVAFSPNGSRVAAAALDHTASVWDSQTGASIEVLKGHKEGLLDLTFADDRTVITASDDRTARIWDIADGPYVRIFDGHTKSVERLAASADGTIFLSASGDKTARVWNVQTGAALAVLGDHKGPVSAMALSPNGKVAVTGSMDTPSRIWDATSGTVKFTLTTEGSGASAAAFSPDGKLVATAAIEGPVTVWDSTTGAQKKALSGHNKKVARLTFSQKGHLLASASWDGTARIWEMEGASEPKVLTGAEGWVTAAVFSPDDSTLTIAADQQARVFDTGTGALVRRLEGHEQQINAVVYSPNGQLIATASLDGTVRTWQASTGQPIKTYTGHTEGVMDVAFSSDGEQLYSAGDNTVRVWDVATGALIDTWIPYRTDGTLRGANALLTIGSNQVLTAAQDGTILLYQSPKTNRQSIFSLAGKLSNFRVCRTSLKVVPLSPQPPEDSVWAPDDACKEK
ncbi:MAG: WD40 repeat domain-containing protein [Polyangiaceae bacterium]|nr:WD40 repeat domain-containing protein [Polyangiaceae bacterium]